MLRKSQALRKERFQHLQLEMRRIQMYAFTITKNTRWKAVTVLMTRL